MKPELLAHSGPVVAKLGSDRFESQRPACWAGLFNIARLVLVVMPDLVPRLSGSIYVDAVHGMDSSVF